MLKYVIVTFLLFFLNLCNQTTEKTSNPTEKSFLYFLLFVSQGPKYIPAKFWGSDSVNPGKLCINYFSHDPSLQSAKEPGRCSNQSVVGVCISQGTGSVSEMVFYSDGYTLESAKQLCFKFYSGNNLPGGVRFVTEYNPNSVYYTSSF